MPVAYRPSLIAFALVLAAAQKSTADGIAEYRAMLADGNPAELFEAQGGDFWKRQRGPRNASLERCDLGLGPGVGQGAWVRLPRWFVDTQPVQDLESRLLTCMQALMGFDPAEIIETPFGKSEPQTMEACAAWIPGESRGQRVNLPQTHAEDRRMYQMGQRAYFFRGWPVEQVAVKPRARCST